MVSKHCTKCAVELWSMDPHEYCIKHRSCIVKHKLFWDRAGCSLCLGILENPETSPVVDYIKKNILSWREKNKILSDDVFLPIPRKSYDIREKALEFPEKALEFPEKALEFPEKALEFPEKALEFPEKALEVPEKDLEVLEKDLEVSEKDLLEVPEKDLEVPEKDLEVPMEGEISSLIPEVAVLPETSLSTPGIEHFADLAKQLLTKMEDRFKDIEEKHKTSFNVQHNPEKANTGSYFQKIPSTPYSSHSSPPHQSERAEFHANESPPHSERLRLKKHVHFYDNEEIDRSILPSDNISRFEFAKRREEFPPIIDQSKPDQFKFSSEWNKAMGVIRVFHPKVQKPIPVDRIEGADYQFNISDESATFISETLSNLRVSPNESSSTRDCKPILNTSKIQFYHHSIPELSDFLSKRKLNSDLRAHISYANPASDAIKSNDINMDREERKHAANAILQLDMMRTMTSLLESRAKNQEDQEFLSAFCNLALTNAECMTSYALTQTASRRTRMRKELCQNPGASQLYLLKANIVSRELFPQQMVDEVGKHVGNQLITFHSRSHSTKRKKSEFAFPQTKSEFALPQTKSEFSLPQTKSEFALPQTKSEFALPQKKTDNSFHAPRNQFRGSWKKKKNNQPRQFFSI